MGNPKPVYQWPKGGPSPNPNGRPKKGYSLTDAMREFLTAHPDVRQGIIAKASEMALRGDPAFAKLLWNYMDGMPDMKVTLSKDPSDEMSDLEIKAEIERLQRQVDAKRLGLPDPNEYVEENDPSVVE